MLLFSVKPEITEDQFLTSAKQNCSKKVFNLISTASLIPVENYNNNQFLKKWFEWDLSIRYLLAKYRNGIVDFTFTVDDYLITDSSVWTIVQQLKSEQNPHNAELLIDNARWKFIEEQESGNDFNIINVLAYYLKLQIVNRRFSMTKEHGDYAYENIYQEQKSAISNIALIKK